MGEMSRNSKHGQNRRNVKGKRSLKQGNMQLNGKNRV
jgi:hypothetical protein